MVDVENTKITGRITIKNVFRDKYFLRGYTDVIKNRGWDADYDKPGFGQWQYERGRHFAAATQGKLCPKVKDYRGVTVLNRNAMYEFSTLVKQGAIL